MFGRARLDKYPSLRREGTLTAHVTPWAKHFRGDIEALKEFDDGYVFVRELQGDLRRTRHGSSAITKGQNTKREWRMKCVPCFGWHARTETVPQRGWTISDVCPMCGTVFPKLETARAQEVKRSESFQK